MITSDISNENIEWALKNVNVNRLSDRIFGKLFKDKYFEIDDYLNMILFCQVNKVEENTVLLKLVEKIDNIEKSSLANTTIDFVMCNPPFFSNLSEHHGTSEIRKPQKRHSPNSVNTSQLHESIYDDGGEVGFVKKIIDESILLDKRIRFTVFFKL